MRLQGVAGQLDWLGSAFLMHQKISSTDTIKYGTQADAYIDILVSATTQIVDPTTGLSAIGAYNTAHNTLRAMLTSHPLPAVQAVGNALQPANAMFTGTQLTGSLPVDITAGTGNPYIVFDEMIFASMPDRPLPVPTTNFTGSQTGGGQNADRFDLETRSLALFTHNIFALTPDDEITAGLRYTREEKKVDADLNVTGVPICDALLAPDGDQLAQSLRVLLPVACNPILNPEFNGVYHDTDTSEAFSGTLRYAKHLSDDLMVYAGIARGYKSGSYNLQRSGFATSVTSYDAAGNVQQAGNTKPAHLRDLAFDEETNDNIELGFKSSWMDGTLTLNGTSFYQEIDGYQESVFNGVNYIVIGSDVISQGVELDVRALPNENWAISGGMVYLSAERQNAVDIGTTVLPANVQLGNAPEYVVSAQATYHEPVGANSEWFAHLNMRWNDKAAITSAAVDTSTLSAEQARAINDVLVNDSFATFNGRLGMRDLSETWTMSLLVNNILDEKYNVLAFAVPSQPGQFAVFSAPPRTIGLELAMKF